jgi:hypothetical protein
MSRGASLEKTEIGTTAQRLFGTASRGTPGPDWKVLRNRWELSHLLRAFAAFIAMVVMIIAIAI